jgi:hypothetical protein
VKTPLLCYDSLVILRGKLMRRFVEQADRGQWTLLPECLDDFIDESNPVRVIDVFVLLRCGINVFDEMQQGLRSLEHLSDPNSGNKCDVAVSYPHSIFAKRLECCADQLSPPRRADHHLDQPAKADWVRRSEWHCEPGAS